MGIRYIEAKLAWETLKEQYGEELILKIAFEELRKPLETKEDDKI